MKWGVRTVKVQKIPEIHQVVEEKDSEPPGSKTAEYISSARMEGYQDPIMIKPTRNAF